MSTQVMAPKGGVITRGGVMTAQLMGESSAERSPDDSPLWSHQLSARVITPLLWTHQLSAHLITPPFGAIS